MFLKLSEQLSLARRILWCAVFLSSPGFALEDAQTIPKGARRIMLDSVHVKFHKKSDYRGNAQPLGSMVERDLRFQDFIDARTGSDRTQLEAFMIANDLDPQTSVGHLFADIRGQVDVLAPSFAMGVTDRLSVGIVIPYYWAQSDVSLGFVANQNANDFLALLAEPEVGQSAKSQEAVYSLNTVKERLNEKLAENGYRELAYWRGQGVGDLSVKAKYRLGDSELLRSALNFALVAPTGRVDDPDILNDIPLGDGSWDLLAGASFDQKIGGPFFINEFVSYTAQLPARRSIRMKTDQEGLAVTKKHVSYDLGDRFDTGLSAQFDTFEGLIGGVGYQYQHKFKDKYQAGDSSRFYEDHSDQVQHLLDAQFGYSSVNAYRRNQASVPYGAKVSYLRQLESRNIQVGDRLQFEMKVFF